MANSGITILRLVTRASLLATAALPSQINAMPHAEAEQGSPTQPQTGTSAPAASPDNEIVVTAQKRSQSINDVPISITAASGEVLAQRGVTSTADLAKIVPGLTYQPSPFNIPVYTLRGVGFFDQTLSASPTVAVYTDEVPLPFSAMTKAAALDLERVEVLKGPQGTLFGQNTTGGAINYIAAKPTKDFAAGMSASYGRFNAADVQGYVSGPLSGTLTGRVAARIVQASEWQKSYTRNDKLGAVNQFQGRVLLDWKPNDRTHVLFNFNGWTDKSDTQAPQLIGKMLSVPSNVLRGAPTLAYPLAPRNARAADWTPDIEPLDKDDYFVQAAIRATYDLTDAVQITSITAVERYKSTSFSDFDGMALTTANFRSDGHINTISQELRLSSSTSRLNWIVGGNYEKDKTLDEYVNWFYDSTTADVGPIYIGANPSGDTTRQNITMLSAFGNVEYEILPNLRAQAGVRYTDSKRSFTGCTYDIPSAEHGSPLAAAFNLLQSIFRADGMVTPIPPGGCITLGTDFHPTIPELSGNLNENNVSWRVGLNYRLGGAGLVYGSVSRGYKAGSYPTVPAAIATGFSPVTQEKLLAYEIGAKLSLMRDVAQFNVAGFYYDYADKQIQGRIADPIFGPLPALVQVPRSRIKGVEAELTLRPLEGLRLSIAGTYIDAKVQEYIGYNNAGVFANYAGARLPYTPKLTIVADGEYSFPVSPSLSAFVGASAQHNSETPASFGNDPLLSLRGYTLLDARLGVNAPDGRWRLEVYGRNLTNEYYWTNALQTQDVFVRYAGMPVTYGVRISTKF